MSPDDSGQRGRGHGGRPGLGRYQDVGSAAGLRSRADPTAAAGSGRAVHQEQHVAGQRAGGDVGSVEEAHKREPQATARPRTPHLERLIRVRTIRLGWGGFISTREPVNVNDVDICIVW